MSKIIEQAKEIRAAMDAAGVFLTDEQAVTVPKLYRKWVPDEAVEAGDRRYYKIDGKLYKAVTAHTTQADWTPDATPALWAVIDVAHTGTLEDPIPASRGMEYEYGKYYLDPEDNNVYICQRGAETGVITLQYLPHELIGQYFATV